MVSGGGRGGRGSSKLFLFCFSFSSLFCLFFVGIFFFFSVHSDKGYQIVQDEEKNKFLIETVP